MRSTGIDATNNRPDGERKIDSPVLLINIPDLIKQIKDEKAWGENDRNAITVYKTDKMRIILIALHKDATMQTDQPENVFSLQVLKGKVNVATNYATTEVDEHMVIAIHAKVSYTISALKKSIFLLTIAE